MSSAQTSGFPNLSDAFTAQGQVKVLSAVSGFPAMSDFPNVSNVSDFHKNLGGFKGLDISSNDIEEDPEDVCTDAKSADDIKKGNIPRTVKFYEGTNALNKTDTRYAWAEFGGDKLATQAADGSSYITRIIERESKKSGIYFKLTERLTKYAERNGSVSWSLEFGAITRRKPAKRPFDEMWCEPILNKIKLLVAGEVSVGYAAKSLASELGVPYNTIRANLWVAEKWVKGETSTFLPHKTMIKPIYELLCNMGKKEPVIISLKAYCAAVNRPSEVVVEILKSESK